MEILLDSADPKEIKEVASWGIISGITTNPKLYSKYAKGKEFVDHLKELIEVSPGYVFTQAIGWHNKEELIQQALWLTKQSEKIVVKLPMSVEGIQAVMCLKKEKPKMKIAVTTVVSVAQAILVGKAGADIVALFNGAFDTESDTPVDIVAPIKEIYAHYGFKTKILSCCRFPRGVGEYAAAGTDMITLGKDFIGMLYEHPYTDKRMLGFIADWTAAFGDRTWPKE